ncbi:hypothetical protein B7494_g3839 [Chlorociboria aeruginascens]|nr:hypothetical protein B7494_g3839 [Chlorociboria aeruginascens]
MLLRPSKLPNILTLALHILNSPAGRVLVISLACWLLAFTYGKFKFWRDPHSAFFNSDHVYDLHYSQYRERQANEYIENAAKAVHKGGLNPEICAAFVTVRRETKQYVDAAIGSLLADLTEEERSKLHLYVLFANVDPTIHPTWKQPWLENVVDEAVGYNVSSDVLAHLKELEEKRDFQEKGVYDYVYALDSCYSTGAPYIAIFEDDIIAVDGWMAKTRKALQEIDHAVHELGKHWDWIYLRLFYSETFMLWNNGDYWYRNMPPVI